MKTIPIIDPMPTNTMIKKQYFEEMLRKAKRVRTKKELDDLLEETGLKYTFSTKQQLIRYFKDELEDLEVGDEF